MTFLFYTEPHGPDSECDTHNASPARSANGRRCPKQTKLARAWSGLWESWGDGSRRTEFITFQSSEVSLLSLLPGNSCTLSSPHDSVWRSLWANLETQISLETGDSREQNLLIGVYLETQIHFEFDVLSILWVSKLCNNLRQCSQAL